MITVAIYECDNCASRRRYGNCPTEFKDYHPWIYCKTCMKLTSHHYDQMSYALERVVKDE